jgi:hypothetical protein
MLHLQHGYHKIDCSMAYNDPRSNLKFTAAHIEFSKFKYLHKRKIRICITTELFYALYY